MFRIKAEISDGLIPSEAVAHIPTFDGGVEEVVVSRDDVENHSIRAWQIHADRDRVLVELPRESMSGTYRIWVKPSQIET